jgi:hypothetical protein
VKQTKAHKLVLSAYIYNTVVSRWLNNDSDNNDDDNENKNYIHNMPLQYNLTKVLINNVANPK